MDLDLDPVTKSQIRMRLYQNVENVEELRQKLMSGELKGCIIKPALILDPFQVVVAANKALTAEKITTKSIFTEILFNLSITKNITKSLQTFGIDKNDKNLLVITLNKKDEESDDSIYRQIVGEEKDLSNLSDFTDLDAIREVYKINDVEFKQVPLIDSIVSRIATKDFVAH